MEILALPCLYSLYIHVHANFNCVHSLCILAHPLCDQSRGKVDGSISSTVVHRPRTTDKGFWGAQALSHA